MSADMSPVVSIKNKSRVEIDTCDELISFISNEVVAYYLDIELIKTQSCMWAVHGQTLTYHTTIKNRSTQTVIDLKFYDTLDLGLQYVVGSFKVNGTPETPEIHGQELSYVIHKIDPNETITISFQVKVL
jgi:uncharacterized repeat protein (TIGR01451 family)